MISQHDFDELCGQLESLRELMRVDPHIALTRIDALATEASAMRERATDTAFEPAITSIQGLLTSLRRGVAARATLADCARRAA